MDSVASAEIVAGTVLKCHLTHPWADLHCADPLP
jgi:hypothetical protein